MLKGTFSLFARVMEMYRDNLELVGLIYRKLPENREDNEVSFYVNVVHKPPDLTTKCVGCNACETTTEEPPTFGCPEVILCY